MQQHLITRGRRNPVSCPPLNNLAEHEPNTLLVKFRPEAIEQAEYIINTVSQRHERLWGPSGIIKLTLKDDRDLNETLYNLRQLAGVIEWVDLNHIVKRASLDEPAPAHARAKLKAGRATTRSTPETANRLKAGLQTPSTIIAVIDSGIDLRHRALKHRIWLNDSEKSGAGSYDDDSNGFIDDLRGWNFVADNNDVSDEIGHGTQVAGIIAARISRLRSRISNHQSIRILPIRALNKNGDGTVADVVEAIDYAVARRAAVINCSFGTPAFSHALLEAIKRAETAGIVVIAAAGNRGQNLSESPFYPASYRNHQAQNLISVAATGRNKLLAGFSNFAADIAAPGENVRTAHRGNSYIYLNGTSASAGFVAATAGALKSIRGFVSAQSIRETILKSARESFDLENKVASKGSVNTAAALHLFTRNDASGKTSSKAKSKSPRARKAALQPSSNNLDTMRANTPNLPNPYVPSGTLPPPTYSDPWPEGPSYDYFLNACYTELTKAKNATGVAGSLPMQSVDPTSGSASVGGVSINLDSRNVNFTLPILSLAGRAGLNFSLALSYNSHDLWNKVSLGSSKMYFNATRGYPAPGWRIGFGVIQGHKADWAVPPYSNSTTGKQSYLYIAPDGTRHDLAYNPATGRYESYDSSYLDFDANSRIMRTPDGTQITFMLPGQPYLNRGQMYPTQIKDRNGNFISINYTILSNSELAIDHIIDTAGRRIDFYYENTRLREIRQNRNGNIFKLAIIDYQPFTISTNFLGMSLEPSTINGTQVYLPTRVTYTTGIN